MGALLSNTTFGRLSEHQTPALPQFHEEPGLGETRAVPIEVSFGPFRLRPTQLLLLEGNNPVPIGSRALEILIALLERPGELVSKQELMDRVWPNVFVEPANLTVHISALRRTLRDGRDGNRFIINIPGRGYMFVGSVAAGRYQTTPLANVSRRVPEIERRLQI